MVNCRSRSSAKADFLAGPALIGLLAALASTSDVAAAQESSETGLSEIVVTAQRREENLQDVPISVSAISGESLASTGITNTLILPQVVPSVQMTRSGPSNIFFIRGVGNSSGGTGEEGANAFYIDGVYLADLAQANTEFNNIERVEVLKGPQGTLFGRNSSGGLVNVITKEPGDTFEAKGKAGFGNYQTFSGQLYVAGPVSPTLSLGIALTGRDQKEGFGKNIPTNEDTGLGYYWGTRAKAVWRPSEITKLTLAGDYWKSKDDFSNGFTITEGSLGRVGTATFPFVGNYNTNLASRQLAILKVWGVSATGEVDFDFAKPALPRCASSMRSRTSIPTTLRWLPPISSSLPHRRLSSRRSGSPRRATAGSTGR